ncbi:MAG TPA: archease [Anaeromyxobacteraceae bacterium]|nr:archease [Anaeromyxobacteraceae bacterium]
MTGSSQFSSGGRTPPAAHHAFEEHTGELALRIEAPTLSMLFEEAGRALSEVMGRGEATNSPSDREERMTVTAPDREALLVEWLNELVYWAEVGHILPREFKMERLSEHDLEAVVRGAQVEWLGNPVKAATFHGLSIAEDPEGLRATIVLDV